MKHKLLNKFLTLALLTLGGVINPAWSQSDKSTDYTGNITLSTSGGTSATTCTVRINNNNYSAIKAGTSSKAGAVKVTVPSGTKYLHLHVAGWNGESVTLKVTPSGYSDNISLTADSNISGSGTTYTLTNSASSTSYYKVITFSDPLASNTDLTFTASSGKRFVIWGVTAEESVVATALSVGTAPTKLNYKKGETLDLTGLVLNATVGGTPTDVTSGYSASPANGATLDEVGAQTVTFTYGGQTTTQTIHVGALESIAITTEPETTTYNEGQTFDPTGMVVEATFSDGESTPTEWTEEVDDYTYSPTAALETSDTEITVSYEWDDVEETTTQAITVNAGVPYTVTFNAGTGSCGTTSLTEASFAAGVTLPTATISVTGWSFAGWAASSTTNTEDEPTLYDAGDTYNPTDNVTLYAVYTFSAKSATQYSQASTLSEVTGASSIVIVNGSCVLDNTLGGSVSAPSVTDGIMEPNTKDIFTLSGNNTDGFTLTNGTKRLGGASSSDVTLASDASNYLWTFAKIGETTNFQVLSKNITGEALERYKPKSGSYSWKTYTANTTDIYQMKIYVPATITVYNSNPAAIVNPSIAFTTASDKSLYVKDEASYDNAANVTGISKTPTYTSSDPTVATVTSAGVVTALKAGSTTITATVAAEVGVNTEASTTYDITVKDAKTVAGLKAITDASSVVTFTADLTDAVVTYVNGSYAYIQDATGAVYASCGSSLTAGDKINGAVSGSIKASYKIDEITAINLEDATVTDDGVIPSALSKTVAQLIASGTSLEGQLVQVSGATVTASLESGNASGGKITDDEKVSEINLYAPASNIEALKDAEGTFKGFISYYNASTYRLNIYEQSQISFTKNAPTDQPLAFDSDAVELDEDTDDYDDFTGQTVSGAQGAVTYSIDSDDDDVVTSINASTGFVVLSGNYGTATIKASVAAKEVTVAGVTTPYKATAKTYTITVYPRYTVTFNVNGTEIAVREASHGAGVAVPETPTLPGYTFRGWNTSAVVAATDTKPAGLTDLDATIYPEDNDDEYYAVYAVATGTPVVEHTSTFTVKQASAPDSPYVSDGSIWTWSNLTFADGVSACINSTNGSVTFTLPSGGKAKSLKITKTSNAWAGAAEVVLKDASSNALNTYSLGSNASATYNFTSSYDHSTSYTLTNTTSKNAWTDNIEFKYETGGITYSGYTTIVTSLAVGSAGYTTYVTNHDVSFPSGVTGYIATANTSSTVTLTSKESVPAGTPIVIKAEAGNYTLTKINTTPESVTGNLLEASDGTVEGDGSTIYALGVGKTGANKGKIGFYLVTEDVTIPAGKAYLEVTGGGVKEFLTFDFGDNADGINSLTPALSEGEGAIYNLAGQRISKMQKGINIVNGKKVLR